MARTKREKREARQRMADFDIAATPRRARQGNTRMRELAVEAGAEIETLEARARQVGTRLASITPGMSKGQRREAASSRAAQLRDLRAPWNGCNAGRAMASITPGEMDRRDLWDAIQHMRRVYAAYDASICAPKRFATCLAILAPTEAMEADAASPPLDDRTDDERVRAARAAFRTLQGWIRATDNRATVEAIRVVVNDQPCRDPAAMVRALHCVVDGIKGRKMSRRSA